MPSASDPPPPPPPSLTPKARAATVVQVFRRWLVRRRRGRGVPMGMLLDRLEALIAIQIEAAMRVSPEEKDAS